MLRNVSIVLATCLFLVVSTQVWGVPEHWDEDVFAGATYVGEAACKKCHFKEHRTWKKMKHANAWTALEGYLEGPDQKDDQGRLCISCHVTGYGDAKHKGFESLEASKHLLGVQCEACHGPGSKHVEVSKKLQDEKRKKFNEGEKTFIVNHTTKCADCHNPHKPHAKLKK